MILCHHHVPDDLTIQDITVTLHSFLMSTVVAYSFKGSPKLGLVRKPDLVE